MLRKSINAAILNFIVSFFYLMVVVAIAFTKRYGKSSPDVLLAIATVGFGALLPFSTRVVIDFLRCFSASAMISTHEPALDFSAVNAATKNSAAAIFDIFR